MHWLTLGSFLFFTGLVGVLTWWITRRDDHASSQGYFLAGRSLTFPLIAGSLLLTNLSTEQMVGLNGAAFTDGLCVMVWEVVAVLALVAMALFFLPRFLKSGVATVPEYLELRYDHTTQVITNLIFLVAYVAILLPIILYTGATGMIGILDIQSLLGIESRTTALWLIVWLVGILGSSVRFVRRAADRCRLRHDQRRGAARRRVLDHGLRPRRTWRQRRDHRRCKNADRTGPTDDSIRSAAMRRRCRSDTLFSGVFLLHLFYWTTNQQIIQRTFGAKSLAEGQKGVLLTGAFKLLGPLYLVLPGMIAYRMFAGEELKADHAYGMLVNRVLPPPLTGFFAAAMIGAILSSFNSALNSSCTLFSLGLYKNVFRPAASERQVVRSGKIFGWTVAVIAMCIAPLLDKTESIFAYLQKMNGMYFIPIFAVVVVGMLSKRVPSIAAKLTLVVGCLIIAIGYFVYPFNLVVAALHEYHFLGLVFSWLVIFMLIVGEVAPRATEWVQVDVQAVDMTPWRFARLAGLVLFAIVVLIYVSFADFSVLQS